MIAYRSIAFAGLMLSLVASHQSASAHTIADLEKALGKQEFYVQITDRPAPDFSLQDADGRQVRRGDFRGKIVILNFIYASCKEACPVQTNMIGSIQQMVNSGPLRDAVQFVTITTDPEKDTADVLKAYGPAHDLDPANWLFLTSGPAKALEARTRELGERYGLKFTRTSDGDFIHGVVTNVIDQDGVLRARFHSLNFDPANLVAYVEGLATGDFVAAASRLRLSAPVDNSSPALPPDSSSFPPRWLLIAAGSGSLAVAALLLIWRLRQWRERHGRA